MALPSGIQVSHMIEIHGDIALIWLTQGCFTVIDAADVDIVKQHDWFAIISGKRGGDVYAATSVDGRQVTLHRFLTGLPAEQIDHRNRQTLDNRRVNLRAATIGQNRTNSTKKKRGVSRYKGVHIPFNQVGVWAAAITKSKKHYHLGTFCSEVEAALAYDQAAKLLHGEFASLNFPDGCEVPHGEREASRKEFRNVEKFRRKLEKIASDVGAQHVRG
jgi:hypothetical protein